MMPCQQVIWIHVFLSIFCLSFCANQSTILGEGSVLGSLETSSTITDTPILTSRDMTTTNIDPSRVVNAHITAASLVPSFTSNTLIPLKTSTSSPSFNSETATTSSCWFCHLFFSPSIVTPSSESSTSCWFCDLLVITSTVKSTSEKTISNIRSTTVITSSSSTTKEAVQSSSVTSASDKLISAVESSSSCWYCDLLLTTIRTQTISKHVSSVSVSVPDSLLIKDTVYSASITSNSAAATNSSETSSSKSTQSVLVNNAQSTLTLITSTSVTTNIVHSGSASITSSSESTSSCWYCHLIDSPSTSTKLPVNASLSVLRNTTNSAKIETTSTTQLEPSTSCWYCDLLFPSTLVQSNESKTSLSASDSMPSSKTSIEATNQPDASTSCWYCGLLSFSTWSKSESKATASTTSKVSLLTTVSDIVKSVNIATTKTVETSTSCWYCHLNLTATIQSESRKNVDSTSKSLFSTAFSPSGDTTSIKHDEQGTLTSKMSTTEPTISDSMLSTNIMATKLSTLNFSVYTADRTSSNYPDQQSPIASKEQNQPGNYGNSTAMVSEQGSPIVSTKQYQPSYYGNSTAMVSDHSSPIASTKQTQSSNPVYSTGMVSEQSSPIASTKQTQPSNPVYSTGMVSEQSSPIASITQIQLSKPVYSTGMVSEQSSPIASTKQTQSSDEFYPTDMLSSVIQPESNNQKNSSVTSVSQMSTNYLSPSFEQPMSFNITMSTSSIINQRTEELDISLTRNFQTSDIFSSVVHSAPENSAVKTILLPSFTGGNISKTLASNDVGSSTQLFGTITFNPSLNQSISKVKDTNSTFMIQSTHTQAASSNDSTLMNTAQMSSKLTLMNTVSTKSDTSSVSDITFTSDKTAGFQSFLSDSRSSVLSGIIAPTTFLDSSFTYLTTMMTKSFLPENIKSIISSDQFSVEKTLTPPKHPDDSSNTVLPLPSSLQPMENGSVISPSVSATDESMVSLTKIFESSFAAPETFSLTNVSKALSLINTESLSYGEIFLSSYSKEPNSLLNTPQFLSSTLSLSQVQTIIQPSFSQRNVTESYLDSIRTEFEIELSSITGTLFFSSESAPSVLSSFSTLEFTSELNTLYASETTVVSRSFDSNLISTLKSIPSISLPSSSIDSTHLLKSSTTTEFSVSGSPGKETENAGNLFSSSVNLTSILPVSSTVNMTLVSNTIHMSATVSTGDFSNINTDLSLSELVASNSSVSPSSDRIMSSTTVVSMLSDHLKGSTISDRHITTFTSLWSDSSSAATLSSLTFVSISPTPASLAVNTYTSAGNNSPTESSTEKSTLLQPSYRSSLELFDTSLVSHLRTKTDSIVDSSYKVGLSNYSLDTRTVSEIESSSNLVSVTSLTSSYISSITNNIFTSTVSDYLESTLSASHTSYTIVSDSDSPYNSLLISTGVISVSGNISSTADMPLATISLETVPVPTQESVTTNATSISSSLISTDTTTIHLASVSSSRMALESDSVPLSIVSGLVSTSLSVIHSNTSPTPSTSSASLTIVVPSSAPLTSITTAGVSKTSIESLEESLSTVRSMASPTFTIIKSNPLVTLPTGSASLTIGIPSLEPQTSSKTTVSSQTFSEPLEQSSLAVSTLSPPSMTLVKTNTIVTLPTSTASLTIVLPSFKPLTPSTEPTTNVSVTMESSTASLTPSSVVVTTPTTSKAINASTAGEAYWVETVLKIPKTVDVSTHSFKTDLENRLAVAYNEAFTREKMITEGNFDPLQKRKRRKRYTQVGDAAVHVKHITREPDSTSVSTAYSVEKSGTVLEPATAISAINTLGTQELAIILRQVVDINAEPYIKIESHTQPPGEESISKLWIIGAVAGPIVAIILIVWLVLCMYIKCCRSPPPQKLEEGGEPQLTSIKNTETQEVTKFSKAYDNPGYSELPRESSHPTVKKGRTYEVNPQPDSESIRTSQKLEETPLTNGGWKQNEPSVAVQNGSTIKDSTKTEREIELVPPKKRKSNRRSGSIEPAGPGSTDYSPRKSTSDQSYLLQSSLSGDDDELKERTYAERKKNKERLREKQQKKKDDEIQAYLESQREIEQVLGAPNGLPDVFVEDSGSPHHTKVSRQDSGVSNDPLSGEETLEEARKRMHRLLDDAFTLISPRSSFQENDLSAIQTVQAIAKRHSERLSTSSPDLSKRDSSTNSKSKISTVHLDSTKDLGRHIKHEPMYFDSSNSYKDSPLETWSPYRASDQVALISMPYKVETKLGGPKNKNKDKDRPATSKQIRRPAASFDLQESKSMGHLDSKYTSSSPQPIVLRSKDLAGFVNSNSDKQMNDDMKSRRNSNGKYAAMTGINGDIYLSGSTTTLSKQKDRGALNGGSSEHKNKSVPKGDSFEMKPVTKKAWGSSQKHRVPVTDVKNNDEVDIINDIKPSEQSDDLIKSLREELQLLKGSFNIDPKTSKKGRKTSGHTMTEIV